jgi:hypothetical protein
MKTPIERKQRDCFVPRNDGFDYAECEVFERIEK